MYSRALERVNERTLLVVLILHYYAIEPLCVGLIDPTTSSNVCAFARFARFAQLQR